MSVWLEVLFGLILLSTIVLVIGENRHPVKTLAWLMVLIFLPVLGFVLYFLFGMDKKHRRLVSDADLRRFKKHTETLYENQICEAPPKDYKDLMNLLRAANLSYPLGGNSVRQYTDFDSMFTDLLADLNSATDHIHFEFFKFEDDRIGRQVEEILVRKASEGVKVRVQYDDAANIGHRSFFRRMREKGVQVQPFIKVMIPFISSDTNYRNHRKVVVVDGKVGYIGGMNIAERYSVGIRGGVWRDTHIRVCGPAVSEMQTSFLVDWQFSSHQVLDEDRYYPLVEPQGDVLMQVATSGPMDEWSVIMQGVIQMIAQSKKYIYIQSPYLIPTEPVLLALRNAALAGVGVGIMVPYHGDKGVMPPLASRSYVKDVITAGVKVYFYDNGYMHSKAIVSDDRVASIGSTNMDVRSYEQDFEINAFIYDKKVAKDVKSAFLADQEHSWLVDPQKWASRSRFVRFKESLARLTSPLL